MRAQSRAGWLRFRCACMPDALQRPPTDPVCIMIGKMALSQSLEVQPAAANPVSLDTDGGIWHYLQSVWRYRYLFTHLAFADLRARFRNTRLGILWAMAQPLLLMVMFSLMLAQVSGVPYAEYATHVLSGVVLWELILNCCSSGAVSYLGASPYLMQSPIPLGVFTLRVVLNALVLYCIGLVTLVLFSLIVAPQFASVRWLWALPFGVLLAFIATPLASICGVLNVLYRDFQHILGLALTGIWMTSPIFAPNSMFEKDGILKTVNQISPVGRLCDIFRGFWMNGHDPSFADLAIVLAWAALFWALAAWLLSRNERRLVFFLH